MIVLQSILVLSPTQYWDKQSLTVFHVPLIHSMQRLKY